MKASYRGPHLANMEKLETVGADEVSWHSEPRADITTIKCAGTGYIRTEPGVRGAAERSKVGVYRLRRDGWP